MFIRNVSLIACVVAVAGLMAATSSQAAMPGTMFPKVNNLTFSHAVALPGVTLAPGTYVFEAGPGGTDDNIVRVLSRNRQRLFYLGFTIPSQRPKDAPVSVLTFGEVGPGRPAPITAWYPVGSAMGHEFLYR